MIHLSGVKKQYGTRILYKDSSFQVRPGDKIGLVGPNGAGKTTIFRIIVGEEHVDEGSVSIPESLVIGYFSQDTGEMKGRSALEEVKARAGKISALSEEITKIEKRLQESGENPMDDDEMAAVLERYGEIQIEFENRGGYDLDARAKEILTGLGIGPDDYDRPVEAFSGGWKMRIALAGILVLKPDVLLMDEPTNHLDLESIVWLEEFLVSYKGALVMTSHDRDFMNRIVNRITEVANQAITTYSGNYDFYVKDREVRRDQLLASAKKQDEMLAKEEEFIARFKARASHAAQVQSRVKKLDKIERIEIPAEERTMNFEFEVAPRSGNDVVKMEKLVKIWPHPELGEKKVFENANGVVRRLDKVALVGVNGAGKSTLLKIIAGQTEPTDGICQLGASVRLGYFSQHSLEVLNAKKTVFQEIHDRLPDATIGFVRNLLGAFLFSGDDVEKRISALSGGEKSRVVLATLFAAKPNFLILDEPTNHLDIRAREVLVEAIKSFEGTVMIVSHDRHFLRALTTRVFEMGKGELKIYEGSYAEYWDRKKGLGR